MLSQGNFAHWGDLYEVCSNLKYQEEKKACKPGNQKKRKCARLKFVGFVLNASISKFQSKRCWKSRLNRENVHFVALYQFA